MSLAAAAARQSFSYCPKRLNVKERKLGCPAGTCFLSLFLFLPGLALTGGSPFLISFHMGTSKGKNEGEGGCVIIILKVPHHDNRINM